ncbi:hypothetical protein [Elizabethkingia ursingii]|uniref:hypothetical protein n=1 Tax=Elizabethkingia ursingii TaxID=1756150 RepID=UPI0007519ECD|nr:hypothetical protein [Elizabethkingia ursingii]KUY31154.1 hypothetical protein ATB96_11430 [Elizabethkingia ursingii]
MKPLKVISDLLPIPSYSIIIICFFFPFFLVKCGSTTLVSVKGTDLVTGISKEKMNRQMKETLKKDSPFGSFGNDNSSDEVGYSPMDKSDNSKGNIPPNPFIIIPLLSAVLGIILHAIRSIRKKYIYHIVLSAIALICLSVFYWTFQSQMNGLGDYKVGFGSDLSITLGFGGAFYICSLLFAILLLFHCIFVYFLRNNPEAIYGPKKPNTTL